MGKVLELLGNAEAMNKLQSGQSPDAALQAGSPRMREFLAKRRKVLIYEAVPRRKKERQ